VENLRSAHEYTGTPLTRVVDFMMTRRGTTLRSLIRRSSIDDTIFFPRIHGNNSWTALAFHLQLVAAGPAIASINPYIVDGNDPTV